MKPPTKENIEGPEGQNTCPKCGKQIVAMAGDNKPSPRLSQERECSCGTGEAQPEGGDSSKTKTAMPRFQSEESSAAGNMPKKLRQLRRTHVGVTFATTDPDKSSSDVIGLVEGAVIGGVYRIHKRIGRGAMGEVYLAEHIMLGKKCALKIIPPEQVTDASWQRFQIEAKAVAMLDHGNLVKVSDLGIHEGCLPFYAMEYVDGETLEELLVDQKKLPLNTALEIFIQVCDGLEYAHRNSIVHRDLKPANIILAAGPIGNNSVKVLDFGLAKLTQPDSQKKSLTSVGEIFGSPPYMSPEQSRGDTADHRSDIYSLGCTLFECLTGRTPFTGSLASTLIYNHQKIEAPSLASVVGPKHFPDSLEVIMAKLLHKNPLERYQSMTEVRRDLELVSRGEKVLPSQPSTSQDASATLSGSRPKTQQEEYPRGGEAGGYGEEDGEEIADRQAVADSWTFEKPPMIVWSLVGVLILGLLGAYWFYTQHKNDQIAVSPVLMMGTMPPSANETAPFSSTVELNDRHLRRFNFPLDVSIGQIHSASNLLVVPARGQIQMPVTDQVYFVPNGIVAKYPNYLKRFRPGDVYAVSIPSSGNGDALVKAVSIIPQVEKLTIYRCKSISGEGLKSIQNYDCLVDLDCSYNKADVANISNMSRLKELKSLRLCGETNIYPLIKKLEHSDKIKELYLDDCPINPQILAIIASLPKLTTLSLNSDNLKDQDLTTLSKSTGIRFLSILKTPVTKNTVTIIKSFPALKVLQIIAEPNAKAISSPQLLDLRRALPALKVY